MLVHRTFLSTLQSFVPSVLIGDFGIGKTSFLYALANYLNLQVVRIPLLGALPEDLIGYPSRTVANIGGREVEVTDHVPHRRILEVLQGNCLVILDELGRVDNERMQNVIATLLDRKIGQFSLPENTYFACTLNDYDIGQFDLNMNLVTRLAWYRFSPDDDLLDRALVTGQFENEFHRLPDNWREYIPAASNFIMMLRKCRKSIFRRQGETSTVYPCPRTIFHLRSALAAAFSLGWKTVDDILAVCTATCGEAFGNEAAALCRSLEVPDVEIFIHDFLLNGYCYEFKRDFVANTIMLFTEVATWIANNVDKDVEKCRLVWKHSVNYLAKYVLPDHAEVAVYLTMSFTRLPDKVKGMLPVDLMKAIKGVQ